MQFNMRTRQVFRTETYNKFVISKLVIVCHDIMNQQRWHTFLIENVLLIINHCRILMENVHSYSGAIPLFYKMLSEIKVIHSPEMC